MLYLRSIMFRQYKYLMMPYHPRVSRLEGNPEAIWYTHLALPLPLYSHSPNVLYVFVLDPDLRLGEQRSCFHEAWTRSCLFSKTSHYSGVVFLPTAPFRLLVTYCLKPTPFH